MKKALSILLTAIALLTTAACGTKQADTDTQGTQSTTAQAESTVQTTAAPTTISQTDSSTDILSPESAIDIFMADKDTWMFEELYSDTEYSYIFLDLDFDGVCELVVSEIGGTGRYSHNRYYKISPDNKAVKEIASDENEYGGYDYYTNNTKLLKSKNSGSLMYYCIDFESAGAAIPSYTETYYSVSLNGETVNGKNVFCYVNDEYTDDGEIKKYYYYENGESVKTDKDTYDKMNSEFFAENTDMNLKFVDLDAREFHQADEAKQKQQLLSAYKGFSYNGFSY